MRDLHEATIIPVNNIDEVYVDAVEEHPEFLELDSEGVLRGFIERELARIEYFEQIARKPLTISLQTAESIGAIRIHSGVGSYDEPFKKEDNPRLQGKPWLQWFDRNRVNHAVRLARKVAEVRSGYSVKDHAFRNMAVQREETKRLIAEYGPYLIYSGYPVETEKAAEVLARPGGIMPEEKVR
jgi:hypothetical protein